MKEPLDQQDAYRKAGVDIDAQDSALATVKELARSTFTPGVLSEIGSFGGLFRPDLAGIEEPVLVASADGVGTKLMVARMAGDYSTVGRDLVNHCVNDILVQGAVPLFFMDYVGAGTLEPEAAVSLVQGVAEGCRENGCALLGGETAEMPGFYQPGDYELVGFIVGLVDRSKLLDGSRVRPGDRLIALPSEGLHTNGYSLARKILFQDLGLLPSDPFPESSKAPGSCDAGSRGVPSVAQELLKVHRSYLPWLRPLLAHPGLHGLAHITGGGLVDNLPRILPEGCAAVIDRASWDLPSLFRLLQTAGKVSDGEMFRVFNMGVGMVLAVGEEDAGEISSLLEANGGGAWPIGEVREGSRSVVFRPAPGGRQ
ncbi:MAG: phosphoribosylformylglycinamidine cyclo-ligase [Acidobacteria bacterium]|nr:phosphoribosylformylglycinamidine cyclo-ligase [Acidobacteriota bacterium]